MQIRELFDTRKDIYRTIEKVIAYGTDQEDRLRREIAEYIVTDHIDDQFQRLLEKIQLAMNFQLGQRHMLNQKEQVVNHHLLEKPKTTNTKNGQM